MHLNGWRCVVCGHGSMFDAEYWIWSRFRVVFPSEGTLHFTFYQSVGRLTCGTELVHSKQMSSFNNIPLSLLF